MHGNDVIYTFVHGNISILSIYALAVRGNISRCDVFLIIGMPELFRRVDDCTKNISSSHSGNINLENQLIGCAIVLTSVSYSVSVTSDRVYLSSNKSMRFSTSL